MLNENGSNSTFKELYTHIICERTAYDASSHYEGYNRQDGSGVEEHRQPICGTHWVGACNTSVGRRVEGTLLV